MTVFIITRFLERVTGTSAPTSSQLHRKSQFHLHNSTSTSTSSVSSTLLTWERIDVVTSCILVLRFCICELCTASDLQPFARTLYPIVLQIARVYDDHCVLSALSIRTMHSLLAAGGTVSAMSAHYHHLWCQQLIRWSNTYS